MKRSMDAPTLLVRSYAIRKGLSVIWCLTWSVYSSTCSQDHSTQLILSTHKMCSMGSMTYSNFGGIRPGKCSSDMQGRLRSRRTITFHPTVHESAMGMACTRHPKVTVRSLSTDSADSSCIYSTRHSSYTILLP
jgi:hypothetical protein